MSEPLQRLDEFNPQAANNNSFVYSPIIARYLPDDIGARG